MEAEAARRSLGMAYVPLDLVEDDLAHGRLIRVLQPYSDRMPALYLYYPQRNASPALKAVAELLRV
ncbi:LysR substrate-binding domain-containing protein [Neisseria sp.]|uniref:LysR substrate-binding domain-containing protein n=1 Tax=Neisseria sp. TaxID=192066 RepID=UPI00289D722E|nr:LysR substrate-binding domain-containing protein [Neisseria sp.]